MKKIIGDNKIVNKIYDNKNYEFSEEVGMDKGELSSNILGYYGGRIGGQMTKRLVEMGQRDLIKRD